MVEANGQQNDQSQGWQKADARILGQILAAQNVIFTLPDTTRIAEFYAQTLLTIPGIIGCRVCLGNQSIQAGEIQSSACDECQAISGMGKKEHELIPADSDFQCALTSQPNIQVIPIDSDQHHFGFFVSKINNTAAFDVYDPFIRNLSKYVAVTLENRLQKDWLQKARDELEHKVKERTHDLLIANAELDAARLAALHVMQESIETRERVEQANADLQREVIERKHVEEALRASERKLGEAAQIAHVGYWERDYLAETINLSNEACQIFGLPLEKSFPRLAEWHEQWQKLIHPEDQPKVMQVLTDALAGGPPYNVDYRVVRSDGEVRYIHSYAELTRDEMGKPLRMFGTMIDITERKRVEDALLFVAQRGWQISGENFFDALAQFLGEKLDMDYVFIDRIDENPDMVETVALYAKGAITPNMRYALKGTPCENVMGRQLCVYPHGIQQLFPEDTLLTEMGAESYIGIPLWDSTGQPIGLIAAMSNKPLLNASPVTQLLQLVATRAAAELERERSNRLLRAREHEFRTLAENLPDNIIRYDREGRIVYVNPMIEETLGTDAERMIGKRIREMYPNGSYEIGAQAVESALASGENGEVEFTMPVSGREKTVHQIRTIVERDEHGEVTGALAIGRDITERKRVEEALRESEEKYRLLHENAGVGIGYYKPDGEVISYNQLAASHMQGKPEDYRGKSIYEIFPREEADLYMERIKRSLAAESTLEYEDHLNLPSGEKWFLSIFTRICDAQQNVIGVQIISQDVTERKQAEAEVYKLNQELEQRVADRTARLEAANKELEAFAYSVSHDLRAPLRHIDGFIQMLQNRTKMALDDQSRHYMDVIAESAKKMGILIDDLLSFSRMGRNEMFKSQVNLNELIQEILREVQPEIGSRNVQWEIASLPIVSGDRAMLRIVLVNLISNALKFTRPRNPAEIKIGYERQESEVVIFVRDNGVGFDMNYADRLFGVFQRLHRTDEFEGTGIGLANVRRIIERHGGKTWAESQIDHGATIYFSLPKSNT